MKNCKSFLLCLFNVILLISFGCQKTDIVNNNHKDRSSDSTDIDGNVFHKITIGTQTWMLENLRVTRYNDGMDINEVEDEKIWQQTQTGAFCNYYNYSTDTFGVTKYGRLYNWFAIETGKLAPKGWHVPSDYEWAILENYLIANGYNYDGSTDHDGNRNTDNKIAKSLGSSYGWLCSIYDEGAVGDSTYPEKRNSSGFNALPGGYRSWIQGGSYYNVSLQANGYWWTSSLELNNNQPIYRQLWFGSNFVYRGNIIPTYGFSVRCLKD